VICGFIIQNKLPAQLKAKVNKETKGVYQLEFDKMNFSILAGSMKFKNIQLIPNTAIYFQSESLQRSSNLFQIQCSSLNISGFKLLKLIVNKNIQASTITFDEPELILMKMHDTVRVDSNSQKSLYQQMPGF